MFTLKPTGERVIVTQSGISFLKGKDDKYNFIPSAYKLLVLISDKSSWNGKHLHYELPEQMPTNDEMIRVATKDDSSKIELIKKKIDEFEERLDQEIKDAKSYDYLDSKEKEAFVNNLVYIKPYRLQRETNKIIYRFMIDRIVDEIHTKEIETIEVPPTRNFFRVLESIQGGLIGRKISPRVNIEATTKNSRPMLRLNPYGN